MEYIPGSLAYFTSGYLIWVFKTFIWKIAAHWSKIWVGDASQAGSQTLSLTVVISGLLLFGMAIFLWSISSHINYKSTEKGFIANFAAGFGIALAVGQDAWLNEIATKMTYVD
jgi:hypothetical protein